MSEEKEEKKEEEQKDTEEQKKKENKPKAIASFLERFVAIFFDYAVLFTVYFAIDLIFNLAFSGNTIFKFCYGMFSSPSHIFKITAAFILILFLLFTILVVISILLEASKSKASLGKKFLGLYVVDEHLKPITTKQSLIRNFSKLLSFSVLGLGFVYALANEKKQSLHDIIAKTVVVRKKEFDSNQITVIFSISFLLILSCLFFIRTVFPAKPEVKINVPKRAVDVLPPAKGFIQDGDSITKMQDSLVVYDPLREAIEVYASRTKFSQEQIENLTKTFSEQIPDFVAFKVLLKLHAGSLKCASEIMEEAFYFFSNKQVDVDYNAPELNQIRCELINDSHFFAKFFRKRDETQKNWELEISSKLKIRREKARLSFNSENAQNIVALWHHSENENKVEVGLFTQELTSNDLLSIRTSKGFNQYKPAVILTFDLQLSTDSLNVATVTKYGVSFIKGADIHFPGKQERVDFYYVPSVTETLQLAKLSGQLTEGERVTGYLNHQAKKVISEVNFDVDWEISFNTALIDLENESFSANSLIQDEVIKNKNEKLCKFKADRTEVEGVDSVALYYPEEGDVVVGIFNELVTDKEREEFRKKKSIWLNVNGKIANFVLFFDLKKESKSFSRELLLEYLAHFIRDNYGRFYFPGNSNRAQFRFREVEFKPEEISGLSGMLKDGELITFKVKKKKESKLTGIKFSWDCQLTSRLLEIQ